MNKRFILASFYSFFLFIKSEDFLLKVIKLLAVSLILIANIVAAQNTPNNKLFIYNWTDYIAEDTLSNFQAKTGIKVTYDVFDSNEVLESKLLAGRTGYDLVVPSNHFLDRQIQTGAFYKLDKSKIPNFKHLNPTLLQYVEHNDPNNQYGIPYLWGTNGIGYNIDKVRQVLGVDRIDSWQYLFEPENLQKLQTCGVAFLDSADEMIPAMLHYLKLNANSSSIGDIKKAERKFMELRPYVTYFHSSKYVTDLANGNICIAAGFSGDVMQAIERAHEAGNGVNVAYSIPKEGSALWFDMMAIPKDAANIDAAHAFINFVLEPKNAADISNHVGYANAVSAADKYMDAEIINNPDIYPNLSSFTNMYISIPLPSNVVREMNRSWVRIKTKQ